MHRRISFCVVICLAVAACGLPKPRPAADVELDREFTAKFGIPGSVPLQPIKPRGVLEIGATRLFGEPVDPATIIKPPPPPVPPIRVEPVPRAPRVGQYSWQPSAWEWNGYAFVWKLGAWVQPPPGAQWTNGQWTKNDLGEWIWLTGGWV